MIIRFSNMEVILRDSFYDEGGGVSLRRNGRREIGYRSNM